MSGIDRLQTTGKYLVGILLLSIAVKTEIVVYCLP